MSGNKNFLNKVRNGFKVKPAEAKEPRALDEITKEYGETLRKVADSQYQAFIYNRQTEGLNQRLADLSVEAAERKKLDEPKKEEAEAGK